MQLGLSLESLRVLTWSWGLVLLGACVSLNSESSLPIIHYSRGASTTTRCSSNLSNRRLRSEGRERRHRLEGRLRRSRTPPALAAAPFGLSTAAAAKDVELRVGVREGVPRRDARRGGGGPRLEPVVGLRHVGLAAHRVLEEGVRRGRPALRKLK